MVFTALVFKLSRKKSCFGAENEVTSTRKNDKIICIYVAKTHYSRALTNVSFFIVFLCTVMNRYYAS